MHCSFWLLTMGLHTVVSKPLCSCDTMFAQGSALPYLTSEFHSVPSICAPQMGMHNAVRKQTLSGPSPKLPAGRCNQGQREHHAATAHCDRCTASILEQGKAPLRPYALQQDRQQAVFLAWARDCVHAWACQPAEYLGLLQCPLPQVDRYQIRIWYW